MNLPSFFLAVSLFFNVLAFPYLQPMVTNFVQNMHPVTQHHSSSLNINVGENN